MNYSPPIHHADTKYTPAEFEPNRNGALAIIALSELFERLAYYGSRALIVLFMTSKISNGGLGWEAESALAVYGLYTFGIYLLPFPISFLIDFLIKPKLAVFIGGALCALGLASMGMQDENLFIVGLTMNAIGVAFIKPSLTTLTARLYKKRDKNRVVGFAWFYIAINVGAFVGGLTIGVAGEMYGWNAGFLLAAGISLIPLVIMLAAAKIIPTIETEDEAAYKVDHQGNRYLDSSVLVQRGVLAFLVVAMVIIFWACFEMVGMHLYYAGDNIAQELGISGMLFQSLNPAFIILLLPIIATVLYALHKSGRSMASIFSIGLGMAILGVGMLVVYPVISYAISGAAAAGVLVIAYLLHTVGEIFISPVAMSYITRLAPVKYTTIFLGTYFLLTGVGNYLAATVAELFYDSSVEVVASIAVIVPISLGILIMALKPILKRLGNGII